MIFASTNPHSDVTGGREVARGAEDYSARGVAHGLLLTEDDALGGLVDGDRSDRRSHWCSCLRFASHGR